MAGVDPDDALLEDVKETRAISATPAQRARGPASPALAARDQRARSRAGGDRGRQRHLPGAARRCSRNIAELKPGTIS